MKTAKEMYAFCRKNGFGKGFSESWGLKHFDVIAKQLSPNEDALLCFIGLHNYVSMTKHDNHFAYAITNKRIIMAQKKVVGEVVQTVLLDNINDITYKKGIAFSLITVDSTKERFNVSIENTNTDKLYNLIHDLIFQLKGQKGVSNGSGDLGQLEELKRLKDKGIITQREFELKKKQILGI